MKWPLNLTVPLSGRTVLLVMSKTINQSDNKPPKTPRKIKSQRNPTEDHILTIKSEYKVSWFFLMLSDGLTWSCWISFHLTGWHSQQSLVHRRYLCLHDDPHITLGDTSASRALHPAWAAETHNQVCVGVRFSRYHCFITSLLVTETWLDVKVHIIFYIQNFFYWFC